MAGLKKWTLRTPVTACEIDAQHLQGFVVRVGRRGDVHRIFGGSVKKATPFGCSRARAYLLTSVAARVAARAFYRRGGRVAEGAPLLREYAVYSGIEGSNPSLSAANLRVRSPGAVPLGAGFSVGTHAAGEGMLWARPHGPVK